MADLITAARTQIGYARKTIKNPKAALEHLAKADTFLDRAEHLATLPAQPAKIAAQEPLSDDPGVAQRQLLERIGVPADASWGAIKGAATEEQARLLVLLGVAGQPGVYADADYSLFQKYYEAVGSPDEDNGLQSWAPKAEYQTVNIWADANPDSQ